MESFIEKQFPVSRVSKESYKERKAVQSQTLPRLGKWWGRKPLILVRAAILGCLMPASDNPKKDMEIFLKLLSMDDRELMHRKEKAYSVKEMFDLCQAVTPWLRSVPLRRWCSVHSRQLYAQRAFAQGRRSGLPVPAGAPAPPPYPGRRQSRGAARWCNWGGASSLRL